MLVGLIGVVAPILPGVPLAWLGFFIYAIGTGFDRISLTTTIVFSVLTAIIIVLDLLAPMLGAKKFQASKWGMLGAFLGAIVGIFTLGFWGIILGPFIGAFLFELLFARKQTKGALKAATGTAVGCLVGALVKIIFILIMAGFFIASLF